MNLTLYLGVPSLSSMTWSPMRLLGHCKVARDVINLRQTKNSRVKQTQMRRVIVRLNAVVCATRNVTSVFVHDAKGGEEVGALIQAQ